MKKRYGDMRRGETMGQGMVSVVIPAYNCAHCIGEAVASVLSQSYQYREIIVVDDGSEDNTRGALEHYCAQGIVRYYRQEHKGPSAARNFGLKQVRGRIVAFLDADDVWEPAKLERSVAFMIENGFDWLCTAMTKVMHDGSKRIKRIPANSWVLEKDGKEIRQLKYGLFFFSSVPVHTPTIVARKECFQRAGLFDESFLVGEDTDLWLRFEEEGLRGGYLDEPLTVYRYNRGSITRARKVDGLREHCKVAKKHAKILGMGNLWVRETYADFLWEVAESYSAAGNYRRMFLALAEGLWYDPPLALRIVSALVKRKTMEREKIHVLYYDPTSGFGGASRCLASWLQEIDRSVYSPVVVAHCNGPIMKKLRERGIPLLVLPFRSFVDYEHRPPFGISYLLLAVHFLFYEVPSAFMIALILLRYRIDVVHLNAKVTTVVPGIIAARLMDVPCVCHLHDTKEPVKKEKLFAELVDRFVVLTDKAYALYRRAYRTDRVSVVSNGIDVKDYRQPCDPETLRQELSLQAGNKVVGIAGRLVEGKGYGDFLQAAALILKTHPSTKFVIVGSDPSEGKRYDAFLKKTAAQLRLEDSVVFTGWREDAPQVMALFDVLVQASSTFPEGFGLTVIEAMALKKPVVVTDIPGPSEIAVHGITGYIVPPAHPEQLARAIDALLASPERAAAMGENGYRLVCEKYSLARTVNALQQVYLNVLAEKNHLMRVLYRRGYENG